MRLRRGKGRVVQLIGEFKLAKALMLLALGFGAFYFSTGTSAIFERLDAEIGCRSGATTISRLPAARRGSLGVNEVAFEKTRAVTARYFASRESVCCCANVGQNT
jgi:hypothetical protein